MLYILGFAHRLSLNVIHRRSREVLQVSVAFMV